MLFLLLLLSSVLAATLPDIPHSSLFIPGRFIVQFSNPSSLAKKSPDSDPTTAFFNLLSVNNFTTLPTFNYSIKNTFVATAFHASSPHLPSDIDILSHLRSLPDVKAAWPVRKITTHSTLNPPNKIPHHSSGSPNSAAFASLNSHDTSSSPNWSPHSLTGVDKLHARGLSGKNITIGIVDSGTFFLHPALGNGFGPSYKVSGGWNFMGSLYDPAIQGFAVPNNNTLDCLGHGTHVAGIAAANNNPFFVAVAPDANIKSYKVFGCTEATSEDIVLAAIHRAYSDGCDIINLSIGYEGGGYQNSPITNLINTISKNGVLVVASAGNGGPNGAFNGNPDATGNLVTSVAALDTGLLIGYSAQALASNGDSFSFSYLAPKGVQPNIPPGLYDLTVVSTDPCSLGKNSPRGSQNSAVIFPQGNCFGTSFYQATHNLGFNIVLSYNQDFDLPTPAPPQYLQDNVFRIQTERDLGNWIATQARNGHSVQLLFSHNSLLPKSIRNTNSIAPASYSSLGPDYSGHLYPLVSAPGSDIFSTFLNNTHARLDGTSMAAPYISGILALYLQSIGGRPANSHNFVANTQHKLVHTANSITTKNSLVPLIKTGAGIVNATSFLDTKSYFGTTALNLGINPNISQISVSLYNDNEIPITYKLSHITAPTVLTKSGSSGIVLQSPALLYNYAAITFHSESVEVPAKGSAVVRASFRLPPGVNPAFAPVFQGKLQAQAANETVAVPYIATVTDDFCVWTPDRQPLFLYDVNKGKHLGGASYAETKSNYQGTPHDDAIPWINVSHNSYFYTPILTGAQVFNLAVVAENFTNYELALPLRPGKNGVLGFIPGFPLSRFPRTQGGVYGRISTPGIPTGKYRLLALALPAISRALPNSTNPADWNTFLTSPFGFVSTSTYPSGASVAQTNAFSPGTGANLGGIITYIGSVVSASTNASVAISPYDTLRVAIPFRALNGFKVGSTFSVALPKQLTNFPAAFKVLKPSGQHVLNVSIKNNTLTATCISDPGQTYMHGVLAFGATLKNPETRNPQLVLRFASQNYPKGAVANVLDLAPRDADSPSLTESVTRHGRSLVVYLPANHANVSVSIRTHRVVPRCAGAQDTSGARVACEGGVLSATFPTNRTGPARLVVPLDVPEVPGPSEVAVEGTARAVVRGRWADGSVFEYVLERRIIGNNYVEYAAPLTGLDKT